MALLLILAITTKWSIKGANIFPNKIASIMPSGNAGFKTLIITTIKPINAP